MELFNITALFSTAEPPSELNVIVKRLRSQRAVREVFDFMA